MELDENRSRDVAELLIFCCTLRNALPAMIIAIPSARLTALGGLGSWLKNVSRREPSSSAAMYNEASIRRCFRI